ncbi:MAG: hypothetical protein GTN40_01140, partial [Candidatus Aenigmarchaeota archaeon]|nr:hypothetical protein [Candidatus Aenigmarchaeota archaeon]
MKHKGYSGQSQLLIPLIIILTSVAAFAANTTIDIINSTSNDSNSSITGDFIGIPQTTEKSFPIEVLADVSINLEVGENLVRATLILDNGDLLENQQIDFYLNNTLLGSGLTNSEGFVDFPVSDMGILKAVFSGDSSLFYNPSEIEKEIKPVEILTTKQEENITLTLEESEGIKFYRRLDCDRCGQHKTPPLTEVNMSIWVNNETGNLTDYYPTEWTIMNNNGGTITVHNETYNKIEFDKPSSWYIIESPNRTLPPTKYYFFSEFGGIISDSWFVIVSDPAAECVWKQDTISYSCVESGGQDSDCDNGNKTWNVGTSCTEAGGPTIGCYIANITVLFFTSNAATSQNHDAQFIIYNSTAAHYPASFNYPYEGYLGPLYSCGSVNNATTQPNSPTTCNLTGRGFNETSYNITSYVPAKGAVSVTQINYQWCWEDEFPKLDNPLVNDTQSGFTAGWGSIFNFSVEVWEPQGNETNISLWYTQTAGQNWMFAGSKNDTSPPKTAPGNLTNFTLNFSCSDGSITDSLSNDLGVLGATKYYKFNATDPYFNTNDTYNYYGNIYFTPVKDNLTLSNATPNNSVINRTDSIDLSQLVNDSIRSVSLGENEVGGTVYIQRDGTNFNDYYISGTNSTGYLNYNLTSTTMCTDNFDVGLQKWYISTDGSACYNGNQSENLTLTIQGILTATVKQPTGNQNYDRGQTVTIKGYIEDDCGAKTGWEDKINFTLITEGGTYYCNPITEVIGEAGNYSCNWDSNEGVAGTYNITVNTSDGYYYNSTVNETDAFSLVTTPRYDNISISPSSGSGWGNEYNYTVDIDDATGEEVNVSFWLQESGESWTYQESKNCTVGTNCTDVWFAKNFTCNDQNTWFFKFNVTDPYGTSNESSDTANSHVIGKDNVTIEYMAGNNTTASLDTPATFILRIYDFEKGTYNLSAPITFNVTKQGAGNDYYFVGTNTTNETGYVIFDFYADPSFDSVRQYWRGYVNTTQSPQCYDFNQSNEYNVTTRSNVPKLENESVSPITGGWGDSRRFNISVYDQNDTTNVSLWRSTSTGGPWIFVYSENYTSVDTWQNLSFLINFTCSEVRTDPWYYKFNATNAIGNKNTTTADSTRNFTVSKNDVIFVDFYGNNTIANRSGSQENLLFLRLVDGNGTNLSDYNASFYVTTDGENFPAVGVSNDSNSSGYVHYYFNPSCSPKNQVGDQMWKVEVGDACYQTNSTNTSGIYLNLTVMGNILITLSNPDGTENVTQRSNMLFLGSSDDDCGDSLTLNTTSGYEEVEYYANNSSTYGFYCDGYTLIGANSYRCYWKTNTSTPVGSYNGSMFVNKNYYYPNNTLDDADRGWLFYVEVLREFVNVSVNPSSEMWDYVNWNFSAVATSGDDENETIKLLLKKGAGAWRFCEDAIAQCSNMTPTNCTHCENQTYFWYANFTESNAGTWFYKFQMNNTNTLAADHETSGTDSFDVLTSAIRIFLENVTVGSSCGGYTCSWGGGNFTFNVTVNTTGVNN